MNLSHRERLQAVLKGEAPDRVPVAMWRHFPVDDQDPQWLARAALAFQQEYDFDLIKVTPASSFSVLSDQPYVSVKQAPGARELVSGCPQHLGFRLLERPMPEPRA